MKYITVGNSDLTASNIVMGNMRLTELSKQEANYLIQTALDEGINFFDHADIYGGSYGKSEELFAEAFPMNEDLREQVILQSKCGIREGYYDFSKEYILQATDGILQRLQTDYLDILLLHRPDTLMDPEEIGEAFQDLIDQGKVRYFGVSNFTPMQIEFLQKFLPTKIIANQVQFSIVHTPLIDSSIAFNMNIDQSINRDMGALEYCRLNNITLQAWSPFQSGFFEGVFLGDDEKFPALNEVIERLAKKYEVPTSAVVTGWITRHPANFQVVLGTTNKQRLIDSSQGSDLPLTKKEWYEIYQAAGNRIP